MRGSRVSEKVENAFRQKWLETGVVSHAARHVKIPVNTGYELAKRAEKDARFVKARDAMRARVVPELEARLLELAQTIHGRVNAPDLTAEGLAQLVKKHKLRSFSYQNPKPQYFRGLVDLFKAVVGTRKDDHGAPPEAGPAVVIKMTGASAPGSQTPGAAGGT